MMLFLCGNNVQASLTITESSKKINSFNIEYLYDSNESMSIDDVANESFEVIPNQFALGYRDGAAWFKVTIINKSSKNNFVLAFTEPFWSELDLYEYKDDKWQVQKNGLRTPMNERRIVNVSPSYSINLSPLTTTTYYLRGKSASSHIGEFHLFTAAEFFRAGRITIIDIYNVYTGALLFIMLLVGFLYFTVRERVYIYYILYVMSFIIWISVQNGFYLNIGIPGWKDALHAIGTLVVLFLILFSKQLLELERHAPLASKLFKISAAVVFLSGIFITLQVPYINLFFNIFSSLFFTMLIIVSVKAWRNNYFKGARYYLIALLVYMPSMALMTLTYNGLLPNNDFTRYSFALGSFIEILFFSFILVSKYGEEKYIRKEIQGELHKHRESFNSNLESEVRDRTKELDDVNKQLLQQTKELELAKQQLSKEATIDALSNLFNRRYFVREAEKIFINSKESNTPISILMMDIDRFKGINDNFGHKTGDDVIKSCAETFLESFSDNDIVARYGGEEFAVLMPKTTEEEAVVLAEKIRKKIEDCRVRFDDEKDISITLSIGVTTADFDTDNDIDDILQRADKALYEAKNKGRNFVVSL